MARQSFNRFREVGDALYRECEDIVQATAEDLQNHTQTNLKAKRLYKTGFLHDSVYKKTIQGTDFIGGEKSLPMISDQPEHHKAYVALSAVYAAIQNWGGRGIPPKGYWEQSVMEARTDMDRYFSTIEDALREAARR